MNPKDDPVTFVAILAAIGAAIGLGKLLDSAEKLTFRLVVGRAVVNAGMGAAAGSATLMFPSADPVVLFGIAAGMASLGTSGVELVMQRVTGGRRE